MTKNEWVATAKTRITDCKGVIAWADNYSSREPDYGSVSLEGEVAERLKSFLEEGIRLMEAR